MSKLLQQYERKGDKKNSPFFEEYLEKIYLRREQYGFDELVNYLRACIIQVGNGDAIPYLAELYLMTPYRFSVGFRGKTHNIYVLTIKKEYPAMIILEPHDSNYIDNFTYTNMLFPRAKEKKHAKYIGELFSSNNVKELKKILSSQEIRFQEKEQIPNSFLANDNFTFSQISYFSGNVIGYTESDLTDFTSLGLGEPFTLSQEDEKTLEKSDKLQRHFGLHDLIRGIDHLASRVLCGDREHAILEFMCMTNYYFWGAYNIEDMNSSTNVSRNPRVTNELLSPAKVFTANNTPFYTKSIDGLASPTEDFVRNFGKRMHHMAYEVEDGAQEDGMKNIDYVVGKLITSDVKFLEQIIGECTDFPDLKQIFSKSSKYSVLITEYVQRCQGYEGFFSKENVAYLTKAAGADEALHVPGHD